MKIFSSLYELRGLTKIISIGILLQGCSAANENQGHLRSRGVIKTQVGLTEPLLGNHGGNISHVDAEPLDINPLQGPFHWGSFRGGAFNSGISPFTVRALATSSPTANGSRAVAEFDTGGLVWATPVIDEAGNVYVGAANKYFYSFTPDGQKRWEYRIDSKADSLIDSAAALVPASAPNPALVVVPGGDGALHALNRNTGERIWKFEAHGASESTHQSGVVVNSFEGNVQYSPAHGLIFAGSDNGTMYALEHSGALKWSKKTGMMIWTAALVSPDQNWMAFGSLDGKLYLVDPNTGIEVAEPYDCKADIKSSPTTDGKGNIFFGNSSGDVVSLRVAAHSGKTKYALHLNWKYQTGREVYSSPTYADGKVLLGTVNGNFYALDASLGTVKWQFKAYSQILSSPLVTRDKVVIFGAKNGKVYALNLTDGERIWSYRATLDSIKSNLDSSPSLDQTGMIHVGSYNGRIYHIPYEFCLTHKTNLDRCEFGGTKDSPAFEYPKTQANLATVVWIPSQLNRSFNSSSALQMRLIVTDRGEFVENAAIDAGDGKVEVEITPHVELAKQVSSDGKYLNLIPKTFFTPNTSYKIKISGLFYRQSHNWFLDRMNPSNWIGRERFEAEETFQIKPSRAEPFSTADEDTTITWGLKSMYLLQPEALDTYTPAALDGQGFLVTAFGFNPQEQKMMMLAIPAIPEHDGTEERFTLLPEPSKIYTINGSYQKDNLRGIGSFTLAAMGGEMPLNPLHFSASIHPQTGNLEGQMHSRSSCLAIKGNGAKYNFPFSLINQLCDPYGYINTMGLFKAYRLPNQNLDVKVSHFNHTSPHEVEIGLQLPHLEGSHLVTLVQYDAKTVKALSHVTEIIKADPSQKSSTWSTRFKLKEECLGCCRRNRAHPIEIFFDQQRLNLADAPECPTTGDNRNP